jgi:DNA-binding response OmpR family regulator
VDRIGNRLLHRNGAIALTELQGSLLECLLDAQGSIVARERLLAALPPGKATHARNVDVYIHRLRKRLLDAGAIELSIEAVRGRGYVLRAPTESAP